MVHKGVFAALGGGIAARRGASWSAPAFRTTGNKTMLHGGESAYSFPHLRKGG